MKTFPLEIQRLTEGKWRQENGDGKKGICILHIARLGDKLNSHPRRFFMLKVRREHRPSCEEKAPLSVALLATSTVHQALPGGCNSPRRGTETRLFHSVWPDNRPP
ncbi:hypothetical protein, partial [Alcanivorax sp. HI0083]|uniref:hypothetical protein n=1 Tax=Alcanivorax sp. HI0083 TaxID=1822258 RepID=UPI001E340410